MTRQCLTRLPDGTRCQREPLPTSDSGIVHAHCQTCESRLTREAFGPVSWHQRAAVNELPPMVVGGLPVSLDSPSSPSAPLCPPSSAVDGLGEVPRHLPLVQAAN